MNESSSLPVPSTALTLIERRRKPRGLERNKPRAAFISQLIRERDGTLTTRQDRAEQAVKLYANAPVKSSSPIQCDVSF
jgi:hypothetical protein